MEATSAYLIPTAAGVWHALASREVEASRNILAGLMRGGASEVVPLAALMEWSGVGDSKTVRSLLFKMQRNGWLSAEMEPFELPGESLAEVLQSSLGGLTDIGAAVLADHAGVCIAHAGIKRPEAEQLAAFGAGLYGSYQRYQGGPVAGPALASWDLVGDGNAAVLRVRHLHIGRRVLHLCMRGKEQDGSHAALRLAGMLSKRYFSLNS